MSVEDKQFVTSLAELDATVPPPGEGAAGKTMHRIERYARQYIGLSPFCCLATSDGKGSADVTPRGDKPGFVRVIDESTLLVPERPGNNRMDSLRNIIQNPSLGLLFFIPGFEDTLRVNGRGRVTKDPGLLAESTVDGKLPKFGVLVAVDEAFFHCAKAFRRSRLWDPSAQLPRSRMPTLARIVMDQMAEVAQAALPAQTEVSVWDEAIEEDYRTQLY
jgi:PPOX class probable FMN-dependent enzyme